MDGAELMMDAALTNARRGFAVFPLRGKLPAISKDNGGHGFLDATIDLDRIGDWWERELTLNVGIATRASGLLVLDVDPRHGGDKQLASLEAEYGSLPPTPEVVTGNQGRHIYLKAPDDDNIPRRSNALAEGIDLPNYVVAPPSVHPDTHRKYKWAKRSHPEDLAVAEAPTWVMTLLATEPRPQRPHTFEQAPGWLGLVYSAIIRHIEAGGGQLWDQGNGGMLGQCPLHDDRNPSFSIHPEKGWKCFAGCGEGRLTSLAVKLGVSIG